MQKNQSGLILPSPLQNSESKVLLHACCAPCSASVIDAISQSGLNVTVLFYNPNIYPIEEYVRRKDENKRFADKQGVAFIDADEDQALWFEKTQGLEAEPERGARCTVCFDMRLQYTARHAHEHGFAVFATTLGISRWKNQEVINACGQRAASMRPELLYWDCNWRKGGGTERMYALAKQENFYRQEYCGCIYSLRETTQRRALIGTKETCAGE